MINSAWGLMLISKSLNHVYGGRIFDKSIMTNYSVALHCNQISYEAFV